MIVAEKIPIGDLKKYIEIAFEDDEELINFYDKTYSLSSHSDMYKNTYSKLKEYKEYFGKCCHYKIILDGVEIGFVFITKTPNLLVSFSINKTYRKKDILISFFNLIRNIFSEPFICLLYNENSRAINWLQKCGMEIENVDDIITKLKI
jgi:hypothetical protein